MHDATRLDFEDAVALYTRALASRRLIEHQELTKHLPALPIITMITLSIDGTAEIRTVVRPLREYHRAATHKESAAPIRVTGGVWTRGTGGVWIRGTGVVWTRGIAAARRRPLIPAAMRDHEPARLLLLWRRYVENIF